jgi:hypothetical protein
MPAGLIILLSDLVRVLIGFVGTLASFDSTVRLFPNPFPLFIPPD